MPATVVVGTQWGDEGKGKLTDLLAARWTSSCATRAATTPGHRIVVDGEAFALQLVPRGPVRRTSRRSSATAWWSTPRSCSTSSTRSSAKGVDCSRLLVSGNAHLIMPYHQELDRVTERSSARTRSGTTKRGIGPAYADKASRVGLRVQDLLDPKIFREKLDVALQREEPRAHQGLQPACLMAADEIAARYLDEYAPRARADDRRHGHLRPRGPRRGAARPARGRPGDVPRPRPRDLPVRHLVEPRGRRGLHRLGARPARPRRAIVGIAKAYITRVGAGPFPTELHGDVGDLLVERGHEFGTNTGRRRRVGWFDAVMARHAVRLNSLTEVALTKLDVLDTLEEVKVCVAYEADGVRYDYPPYHQSVLHDVRRSTRAAGLGATSPAVTALDQLPDAAARVRAVPVEQASACRSRRRRGPGPRAVRPLVVTRCVVVGRAAREHALAWALRHAAPRSSSPRATPGSRPTGSPASDAGRRASTRTCT